MKIKNNNQKGLAALEILIALFILVASISAAIMISFGNQTTGTEAELSNKAIYLARENIESARAKSRNSFASIVSSSSAEDIYLKEISVTDIDAYTKKVVSKISWATTTPRPQEIELTTILTDWEKVVDTGGDTGGSGLTGDWRNPRTLGSVDLGPGNSATGLDVLNKIVYLSAVASDSKKPDFYIVDATDGQNPRIISDINTGDGLNAVDVASQYAYAGNNDTSNQLQIINISNINNPYLLSSLTLSGVSGSGAIGNAIFYYDSKVYIGTQKATGPEFHIIDVSDPSHPASIGSKEVNADVNAIYVNNNIAYLATSDEELKIYDISNPAAIALVGFYDAPGDSEDGKSLYLSGNKLYLGRTVGGNHANHHEFHILDVSSSTTLLNLGSKDIVADVNGTRTRDNLAFLATSDSNKEFQIWDISNPANITFWGSFNFPQVATGIDYESNIVYVSVRSNDALRIITSSP